MPDSEARGVSRNAPDLILDMDETGFVYTVGTSFPPYPTLWERCFRTDIRGGMEFVWNGTYWLSDQRFYTSSQSRISSTGIASNSYVDTHMFDGLPGLGVWVDRWIMHALVAGTNNPTNYWEIRTQMIPSGTQNVRSWTGAVAGSAWADISGDANLLFTEMGFHWYLTKINAPANIDFYGRASYRLRAV